MFFVTPWKSTKYVLTLVINKGLILLIAMKNMTHCNYIQQYKNNAVSSS